MKISLKIFYWMEKYYNWGALLLALVICGDLVYESYFLYLQGKISGVAVKAIGIITIIALIIHYARKARRSEPNKS